MATYFVDGNAGSDSGDGSSGQPWKRLAKALAQVAPGDEVRIRSAVYNEELPITVRNTTWRADTGHTPVLDGKYHEGLFSQEGTLPTPVQGDSYLPTNQGSMIRLREEGITVDGLTIRNCAGTAVGVSSSNCTVRNCRIDFTYDSAIKVNPTTVYIENVVVENNVCSRASMRYFDPNRNTFGSPQNVVGVIKMGLTRDGIIRNNICAYGYGEGINIGKGNYRIVAEGNIVHTCNHVHIYINRSIDVIVRNNLVYHLYTKDNLGANQKPPAGIIFGDESTKGQTFPHTSGGYIYNNLVIGLGSLFMVRNNANNYNTQLINAYIGYNTFVGLSKTEVGINITANTQGRPHQNSVFENNIIINAPRISLTSGDIRGVAFRNNLWGELPDASMRGPGDRIGDPNLVNPTAELNDPFPDPINNMDPRNYQLTSRSALAIGMASNGSRLNSLNPPTVHKDFFGANRDANPDIGAHEYAGVMTSLSANFSIGPGQGVGAVPHTVDFTDKSTAEGQIVSHAWTFGDGGTSTEANPSHTYTEPGIFDVSLTVTDNQGNSDVITQLGVVEAITEPNTIIPDTFRRFALTQTGDMKVLAYGTQYPDLRCVVIWNEDPHHILNFSEMAHVVQGIVEPGKNEIFWIDPSNEDEPMSIEDETLPLEQQVVRLR